MNAAGNRQEAKQLAMDRWAARYPFDLSGDWWDWAFSQYQMGEVLEAGKRCAKYTMSNEPEVVLTSFRYWLDKIHSESVLSYKFN